MRLICVLSIAFALGATPAFAEPVEPKIVPKCKLAGDVCGYTLGEWKLVLEADAELFSKRKLLEDERKMTTLLEQQKVDFQKQTTACLANQTLLITRSDKLTTDLIDLDKKYQNERVRPRWGSPLAWTVAAVSTAVLAGFVVRDLTD